MTIINRFVASPMVWLGEERREARVDTIIESTQG